ncbi:DinB family protein [Mucilaginibacter myungsuensis]|uniref:DinB family protein n=1 Tax=Mucilaginibacter myungsuensis TaxID=649104 RepID=A0A929L4W4_9SPHI|nr:DinB family protein [Mucilaginibacter myungsuensis]MBE9664065.1 DinB family protein [Mucilaginibacter myungsuensis]MDN3601243.1 DinB family protein [Mucilaginibacter myungsuensis]
MKTDIITELKTTREGFLNALALSDHSNFNTIPFEGSWTAGQVAEHIYKSIDGMPGLLSGDAKPTERDPNMMTAGLREMFLNFETKMQSPDFILPSDEPKELASLTQQIGDTLNGIIEAGQHIDVNLTVVGFEFPNAGPVTRIELLNFVSVHVQRHAHQLKQIRERL